MDSQITLNVKNDLFTCVKLDGENYTTLSVVDYLKTLDFAGVYNKIKKNGCCNKQLLRVPFRTQCELNHAVGRNDGDVTFAARRGYTAVILTFKAM